MTLLVVSCYGTVSCSTELFRASLLLEGSKPQQDISIPRDSYLHHGTPAQPAETVIPDHFAL